MSPLRMLIEAGSMAGMTDGQLVERFATGRNPTGEAAFAVLVARHGPMVLGVCRGVLGDEHAADDAYQAVFLVLARRAGSIERPDLLGPWLHGVAARVARKARARAHRRRRREGVGGVLSQVAACEGPDPRPVAADESAALHEEIGRLPERYRRAVVLCHFEGLTHAEAARRLGCAPGTVGSLVSRARDMLRSRLARRGLSASALVIAGPTAATPAKAAVSLALERATVRAALSYASNRASVAGLASATAVELAAGAVKTMILKKLILAGALTLAFGLVAGAGGGIAAGLPGARAPRTPSSRVQDRTPPAQVPAPSLPGAVARPPDWLVKDAPFDVASFFALPPDEDNAEPRYLEALFEFDARMAVCFPEGPDRESRARAADRRSGRFGVIDTKLRQLPGSVPDADIDALLDEYESGFRKLDWAQRRPRCVFRTGVGITSLVPHVQAARHVARVAVWKVRRELDRGEVDAALRDVSRVLRLSSDLIPRGVMIVDMVSKAIDSVAVKDLVMRVLTAPGLTVEQCDRLLALLTEHDTRTRVAYSEGLRAEYLSNRVTLHDFVFDQRRLREHWARIGTPIKPSASVVAEVAEPILYSALAPGKAAIPPRPAGIGERLAALAEQMGSLRNVPDLDARLARTTPDELATQVGKLNELYRGLLDAANAPYRERIEKSTARPPSLDATDLHTRVTRGMLPAFTAFVQRLAGSTAMLRAAEGLVVVRRWQLAHGGTLPPSLEAAAKEARLPAVPVDPYDGRPIRFTIVDGQPTVYAIGQDGRDDGGKIDNARTPNSGDVLLRLPGR